jgi:hypothetical protein
MSETMSATAKRNIEQFSPDDYVITLVRRALQNKQDVVIALAGVGEIVVRGTQGEYLAGDDLDMQRFCTAPVGRFQVTVLAADAIAQRTRDRFGRNIDELMWMAGFHASGGRLMKDCSNYDVVQMRHWPNLSRVPHTPNCMRIVAMLTQHPTSIAVAYRLLKIEAKELYQVYSAARCAGLARVVNGAVREPVLKPHRNQTLLSQLMSKIAGL